VPFLPFVFFFWVGCSHRNNKNADHGHLELLKRSFVHFSMLHALFYAEFDNTLGPVVLFDAPKGSVSDSVGGSCLFDAISDYSITGPQVCGSHFLCVFIS
jgi:hypothetical protein